jgi:hypothetical protein
VFAANLIYKAEVAGQNEPITLTFPARGEYQIIRAAVIETGTISGLTRDHNRWTFNLTPAAGSPEGLQAGVLQLDFTAPNAGAWAFTPTARSPETGTFTVHTADHGPAPIPTEPDDRTSLFAKTLQITYAGGGGERFHFISGLNVSYQDGAHTGTYTWDQPNARLNVRLNNGFLFDITIPEGSNEATVVFGGPGTPETQTDTGTYTLQ